MPEVLQRYKKLPIAEIEPDQNQPRHDYGTDGDKNRLKLSLEKLGLQTPILVLERHNKRYLNIDGHRRYMCLKRIGVAEIPCLIIDQVYEKQVELIRHETQNNRRAWRPIERSEAYARISSIDKSDIDTLAEKLGISKTLLSSSLELRNQNISLISAMERYNLNEAFQTEFVKLRKRLCKIREIEVSEIQEIILEKIKDNIILNSKDLRVIARGFDRLEANEDALVSFLVEPAWTVQKLHRQILLTSFSHDLERVIRELALRREQKISHQFSETKILIRLKNELETMDL